MPYLKKERIKEINFKPDIPKVAGELNYVFTMLALEYIRTNGLSYQTINDIVGALECCKLEFVRRVVNPYEDKKIIENGDCY